MAEVADQTENQRAGERTAPTVYHIPVCPFSQRLEILLTLKGCRHLVDFHVVDITRPRPGWLLEKTRGTTALPVLETEEGGIIKESMVILQYLEDLFPEPAVAQRDHYRRAVEGMMNAMEGDFCAWGYRYVLNQDPDRHDDFRRGMLERYARLDEFLTRHNPAGTFLFDRFGLAETVFTVGSTGRCNTVGLRCWTDRRCDSGQAWSSWRVVCGGQEGIVGQVEGRRVHQRHRPGTTEASRLYSRDARSHRRYLSASAA